MLLNTSMVHGSPVLDLLSSGFPQTHLGRELNSARVHASCDHLIILVNHGRLSNLIHSFVPKSITHLSYGWLWNRETLPIETVVLAGILVATLYFVVQFLRPFVSLYFHLKCARKIGLPMKIIPFPPGLFSFFAFQILRRLGLIRPGTKLHTLLSMGRPDGYDMHKEMGDVFITVSPAGLTLIIADPKVATHVNSKRSEFPKPPNTGGMFYSSSPLRLLINNYYMF